MSNRRKTQAQRAEKKRMRCGRCNGVNLGVKSGYGVVCKDCGAKQNPA